ncbi:membrane lipoprotein lipid attachment site-containing protein [Cytobacillus oceanisediminis]|uniref:membrane lipoprotein lipid attachment site-containing protein n=1 Tax=Cytobacillus oceanisediminis TaxID=665099 RepID=UPI00204000A9|nr:membrane lipoprotein lipid attachment site-containing protein [Cytobacillus oceanisediminis]MCM3242672.1 membrane lipoprotein lipid attachment site-containing protein [Cytobacillus oceanisediminis]
MKKIIMAGLALFLLAGCQRYSGGEPVETEEPKEEKQEDVQKEEPKPNLSLEEKVTAAIHSTTGKEAEKSDGKKRIISINTVEDAVAGEGKKIVNIDLNADQHSRVPRTRDEMLLASKDIFPTLFKEDEISEAALIWHLPLVDNASNEEDVKVLQLRIRSNNNINWDNFDIYKFEEVADQYYEHDALKE